MTCPTMLVVDFETTGLDPFRCSALSYGAVLVANDGVLRESAGLVKPELTSPLRKGFAQAAAIHGISWKRAYTHGLKPREVVERFEALRKLGFEKTGEYPVLAAQNTHFDYHVLRRIYQRAGAPFLWSHRTVDLPSIALVKLGVSSSILVSQRLGIPYGNHDALADARFAAIALMKLTTNSRRALPQGAR